MLKIDNVTSEVFEKAEEMGYIVNADVYEDERDAEIAGFYWVDEFGNWVNVAEVNELIEEMGGA